MHGYEPYRFTIPIRMVAGQETRYPKNKMNPKGQVLLVSPDKVRTHRNIMLFVPIAHLFLETQPSLTWTTVCGHHYCRIG